MRDVENYTLQEQENTAEAPFDQYDVIILGGGLAGLTLSLELKRARPAMRILVIEKQKYPVPEAAHKVGESTVEIGAHYLRDILGLKEHLKTQQLIKFGLRFFFSTADNRDITRRMEVGHAVLPPLCVETYQLDRGRLENALEELLLQRGITLLDSCKVQQITLQPQSTYHHLQVGQEGSEREIQTRWIVDASGRSSLLKRQLGLVKKTSHTANAVWFRIGYPIDINTWSADPEWLGRIREGERSLSTNHLMGPGYWVWLIPLASGSISIGIVTDANMYAFEEMNLFERALAWLHKHEPQCAGVIEQHRDKLQDFRVLKDYSYSSEQVYSAERWCLTGDAGVFLDPFYSPGSDMIAISNGLICDLITRDLDGEDINERAAISNRLLLILNDSWRGTYEHQYPLMGNAQIMTTKIIWDTSTYWAVMALLYFHNKFLSFGDNAVIALNLLRFALVNDHVQAFLREWHQIEQRSVSDLFIRYYDFDFMPKLHIGLTAGLSDAEFEAQFVTNVHFVERLAGQLVSIVIETHADRSEDEAIQSQVQRWEADPFLAELIALYQEEEKMNPINSSWITPGRLNRDRQEVAR